MNETAENDRVCPMMARNETHLITSRSLSPVLRQLRGLPQHRVDPALPTAPAAAEVRQHIGVEPKTHRLLRVLELRAPAFDRHAADMQRRVPKPPFG